MYNPDQLIVTKEETRFPWEPFKSRTGDPPTSTEPSSTVVPTPQPIAPKLCPFRKLTFFKSGNDITIPQYAQYMDEEFQPCLREQCAVWNPKGQICCY